LRHFENLPSLPSGYYGMYLEAYFPSLWFKILDARLLALPHIDGDLSKVNVDPAMKQHIYAKYGQAIA
jgi:alkane 1-monooxygenase